MELFKGNSRLGINRAKLYLCMILMLAAAFTAVGLTAFAESAAVTVNLRTDTTGASGNQSLVSVENAGGKMPFDNNEILGLSGNTEGRREYVIPNGGNKTFTLEASIYADDGARLCFTESEGAQIFAWNEDGSITLGNPYGGGKEETVSVGLVRGRWHRAAITYNASTGEYEFWCDGVSIGSWRKVFGAAKMGFGMLPSSESGRALFDNVIYYEEAYNADSYELPSFEVNSENAHLDNGAVYYGDMAAASELLEAIKSDAAYFGLYKDKNMTEQAAGTDALTPGMVLVCVSEYDVCSYYTVMRQQLSIESVEFTDENGAYGAKAVLVNGFGTPKSALMIMVLKNENGEIEKVRASNTAVFSGKYEMIIEPEPENAKYSPEVFFLESWENMIMVIDGIVKMK